ncbi:selection and upkeep of intraepithelial T-cells protein 3-like isoform X1 [Gadus morhua]|uniref:selection and upkeep of intraepithelial T-cells protein 3-like isoform X1 n=1 Tax=Gadus morhua TaxID=8049 RepID=UPI0011B64095|nr:selection and upkeep of intraepithelial T-cells protein 3-like isoform X1 [Gadus morhua]
MWISTKTTTMVYSTKLTLVLLAFRSSVMLSSGAGIPEVVTNLEDTDTEVFTREGEDAILPCGLGSPVNLKDEVFDWKKEQQEVFFYEKGMDYNNGKRGQDPQFGGRVGLLPGGLQAGNASVVLSSVTEADGGVYKCIFPPLGPTRLIRLTVERVPDDAPPNIRNAVVEPRLRLEVVEAPPSSGSVRLSCFSRGGQQQPSGLEWQTPNGTVIPAEEAPPAASSDSDGCYSISQTVKVTEPGNYTCLARQQGVHPAVRGTIQVFVNWQSLTGDHEEVFWNGTNNALCVLSILSIMLSFGAKMYKCCAKKKNSKEGIV